MASNEQQDPLLSSFYVDEMEPESKSSPPAVVEGVPLHPSVAASASSPSPRSSWSTGLLSCLGSNDEFCSSDLEVCVLGCFTPCLLHGSNVERLHPTIEGVFPNHCLSYSALLCIGNLICQCNALAPCFSYTNRTAIRRKYNLMGTGECFAKSCGCSFPDNENRECYESACDFATHTVCHPCALCQEGREVRRRVPHPGFFRSYVPLNAPTEQVMTT